MLFKSDSVEQLAPSNAERLLFIFLSIVNESGQAEGINVVLFGFLKILQSIWKGSEELPCLKSHRVLLGIAARSLDVIDLQKFLITVSNMIDNRKLKIVAYIGLIW